MANIYRFPYIFTGKKNSGSVATINTSYSALKPTVHSNHGYSSSDTFPLTEYVSMYIFKRALKIPLFLSVGSEHRYIEN